jgi:hypothetical protein
MKDRINHRPGTAKAKSDKIVILVQAKAEPVCSAHAACIDAVAPTADDA